MQYTTIDWAEYTMNLITGCEGGCPYCYARNLANVQSGDIRKTLSTPYIFKEWPNGCYELDAPIRDENGRIVEYPFAFAPTLHRYKADGYRPVRESRRVLVNAISDGFGPWIPDEWIRFVFDTCMDTPQHYYMFLTRYPERYRKVILPKGRHYWYGATITCNADLNRMNYLPDERHKFLCLEPLLENLFICPEDLIGIDWITIGAQTGRSKKKVIPQKEWILNIASLASRLGIPVYMRDNLADVMGEENLVQEYPMQLTLKGMGRKQSWATTDRCGGCGKKLKKRTMVTLQARAGTAYKEKSYKTVRIAAMCRSCYEAWCAENRFDTHIDELFPDKEYRDGKEKKLQKN